MWKDKKQEIRELTLYSTHILGNFHPPLACPVSQDNTDPSRGWDPVTWSLSGRRFSFSNMLAREPLGSRLFKP